MPTPRTLTLLCAVSLLAPAAACSDGGSDPSGSPSTARDEASSTTTTAADDPSGSAEPVIDPGDGGDYRPQLDPAEFVAVVDNPYLPFVAGTRWVYEGTDGEEVERIEVEVLPETRVVMGITGTVVRDRVFVGGDLVEDTFDWYAQDAEGNVWYLGEDSKEIEDGRVANTDGSWEAGVDGALPGIVMLADPTQGDAYRQELYEGEAEDLGEVIDPPSSLDTPAGTFSDLVRTRDWNPLDPEVIEEKTYAARIGLVHEEKVRGGDGAVDLVEHIPAR